MKWLHFLLVVFLYVSCDKNPVDDIDDPNIVIDKDGNVYQTLKIGNQVWTVENWRCTKYNDGTAIPKVTDGTAWAGLSTPGYCYYNNSTDADTIKKWGALYSWYVVSPTNPKQIAPEGWRVPTDADWIVLLDYLIKNGYNWDGTTDSNKIAKSMAAKTDWLISPETGTTGCDLTLNNSSGFSALPGGFRGSFGDFYYKSEEGYWWSATTSDEYWSYFLTLRSDWDFVNISSLPRNSGFSVRIVRDN